MDHGKDIPHYVFCDPCFGIFFEALVKMAECPNQEPIPPGVMERIDRAVLADIRKVCEERRRVRP